MHADIVIKNGKCITCVDEQQFSWIAIEKDKILALGNNDAYETLTDEKTVVIDAKGSSILPGFIDSHCHVVQTGLNSASLDLSQAYSFDEIGSLIEAAQKKTPGKPIRGIRFQLDNLKEKKFY